MQSVDARSLVRGAGVGVRVVIAPVPGPPGAGAHHVTVLHCIARAGCNCSDTQPVCNTGGPLLVLTSFSGNYGACTEACGLVRVSKFKKIGGPR